MASFRFKADQMLLKFRTAYHVPFIACSDSSASFLILRLVFCYLYINHMIKIVPDRVFCNRSKFIRGRCPIINFNDSLP